MEHFKQKEPCSKILCVGGSPRKKGNSDTILEYIQKGIHEALHVDEVQLRDLHFSSCIGCERCRKDKACLGVNDDMQEVHEKIISSQGLVLVSPAHNYNVTALMKAFIDRMYTFYNFGTDHPRSWNSQLSGQKRKALIVALGEQTNKEDLGFTLDGMRLPLEALGYEIIDSLEVYGVFERGKVKEDEEVLQKVKSMGANLAHSMHQ